MKKSAKNVVFLLVFVGFVAVLGGCVPADCKGCRWWSFSDGYKYGYKYGHKYGQNKFTIKPFAEKMEDEAKGNINIRAAAGQPVPLPKEFKSVEVVRAVGVEMPDLTDESLIKIKETIIEWLEDNDWVVKEAAETPLALTVTFTSYQEGSLTNRILKGSTSYYAGHTPGTYPSKDRAEMCGQLLLQKGTETVLDMDLAPVQTAENAILYGRRTNVGIKTIQRVFAQIIVDTLNDYWNQKLVEQKQP